MKRIEFTTNRGSGYVEIPDDTVSIKIPEGINKDTEILTHGVFTNEQDTIKTQKDGSVVTDSLMIPTQGVEKNDEDDLEKLIPNLNL